MWWFLGCLLCILVTSLARVSCGIFLLLHFFSQQFSNFRISAKKAPFDFFAQIIILRVWKKMSTVLEQDHFYSDFLLSQTTVSTNFNHLEDEARHSLDRRECSYTWYAALVTFIYHECSTERLGSNFHHMLNLLKVLIAHFAH